MITPSLVALTTHDGEDAGLVNDIDLLTAAALLGDLAAAGAVTLDDKERVQVRALPSSADATLAWAHSRLTEKGKGKPQNILMAMRALYFDGVEQVASHGLPDPESQREHLLPVLAGEKQASDEAAVLLGLISAGEGIPGVFGEALQTRYPQVQDVERRAAEIAEQTAQGQWATEADAMTKAAHTGILMAVMTTSVITSPLNW